MCFHSFGAKMSAMNYNEFQRQLGKAGLTVREFAELVCMNRNSITNCSVKGEVPSHLAVIVTLMGAMADHRLDFRSALEHIGLAPKKPRGAAAKGRFGGSKQADLFAQRSVNSVLHIENEPLRSKAIKSISSDRP
jgi:hypothetical protein